MLDLLVLAMLIITATLLAWLSLRAWQAKNRFFKMGEVQALASLVVGPPATLISVIAIVGLVKVHARTAPVPDLRVAGTPEQIPAWKKAISAGFCSACHTKTGTLTGGLEMGRALSFANRVVLYPPISPPPGQLSRWSDGDIFRAIRNGVDPDGRWLIIMSYTNAGKLSDDDIRAVIAYIRSLPATGEPTRNPPDHLNLLGDRECLAPACYRRADRYLWGVIEARARESHVTVWRIYPVVSGLPRSVMAPS